jgi:hypothetical protein
MDFNLTRLKTRLMKNSVIALGVLVSLIHFNASAAEAHKKTKPVSPTETAPVLVPNPPAESSYTGDSQLNATGSIGAIDGQLFYGPGLQIEWPVTLDRNHFAFGAETHFFYSSRSETSSGVTVKSKAWTIPLFFTGKYFFPNNINFVKPYFAVSIGPTIDHVNGDVLVAGNSVNESDTTLRFAFTIRPGTT